MSFLEDIVEHKKEEIKELHLKFTLQYFKDQRFFNVNSLSLKEAVSHNNRLGIIAELKKASPSKGILRETFIPLEITRLYLKNKVDAISILTDKKFFMGDIEFISQAAKIKMVPILRKDFILDEFQIYEAKAFGADAVLLIAEILSKNQINELTAVAAECGLEVLLEIHSIKQFKKINFNENTLIGINNRDLESFNVNPEISLQLSELLPPEVIIIAESGINNYDNIKRIKSSRINGVLVGEHFMKSENIEKKLIEFIEWCKYEN